MCVSKVTKPSNFSLWPQWLAALHAYLIAVMVGATIGLMAPLLARLLSPESPFEVTIEQTTWVASLYSVTTPLGSLSGAVTSTFIGSKLALHICGLYYTFGWLCLICANSIEIVYICLLFNGFGSGTLQSVTPVYIIEIADPKIRSGLMALSIDGISMGILLGNIMGNYLEIYAVGAVNLALTLIYLISFSFFPSSPYYFIRRNKIKEAVKSLEWYNREINSSEEIQRLLPSLKNGSLSFFYILRQIRAPHNRNALLKIFFISFIMPFIGIYAIVEYMQVLLIKAKVTVTAPSSLVISISVIVIIAGWIATYTSDKFNRKKLMISACIAMSLAFIVWGLCYHLLELGFIDSNLQWMAIISAIICRSSLIMGLTPIIATTTTEMLTPALQQLGSTMCCVTSSISIFIVSKSFQYFVDYLTHKYVMYMFAGCVLLMAVYVQIFIPETKGKTLKELSMVSNKTKISAESDTLIKLASNLENVQTNS